MTNAQFQSLANGLNTLGRNDQKILSAILDLKTSLEQKMDKIIAALTDLKTTVTQAVTDAGSAEVVTPANQAAALQAIADIKTAVGALDTKLKGG